MSILDLTTANLNDTFEPTVMEKGTEAHLRITSCIEGTDKNNVKYIMPFFEVIDEPYCKEFGDYFPLPHDGMSAKDLNKAKLKLANFFKAFDIDATQPIDLKEDLVGNEGWAILGLGKDKEDQPVNSISNYVIGG
jgi:hypothetical protein